MKSRYYNPTEPTERKQLSDALAAGHTIVNAPRPLKGENSWRGEWCTGIYWATGDLATYLQEWQELKATIVVLVDDEMLSYIAKAKYDEQMKNPDYASLYPSWETIQMKYTPKQIVEMLVINNY